MWFKKILEGVENKEGIGFWPDTSSYFKDKPVAP
jgi:hypothetical protein